MWKRYRKKQREAAEESSRGLAEGNIGLFPPVTVRLGAFSSEMVLSVDGISQL